MTTELAERRKGQALTLMIAAGALMAIAAVTVGIDTRASRPDLASGPVAPGLADSIGNAQRIIVTSDNASYRIEKTQSGWAMIDRGNFPVERQRLDQLTQALEQMHYTRRMTSDPEKFDRLGVGDPRHGGHGVLLQIESGAGAFLVNTIIGAVPTAGQGVVYVRRPDQDQTWAALTPTSAPLPPLRDVASWLDLKPLDLSADSLVTVSIAPAEGRPYTLARSDTTQPWRITSPPLGAPAQTSLEATAQKITDLTPVDVQPAPVIQGAASAHLLATTTSGVVLDGELIASGGKTWLKLVARAPQATQEATALAINNRVAGWAYALSDVDLETLAPSLSTLVPSTAPAHAIAAPNATPAHAPAAPANGAGPRPNAAHAPAAHAHTNTAPTQTNTASPAPATPPG
jgi:hypothetical protein